jgi:hypothetical protein
MCRAFDYPACATLPKTVQAGRYSSCGRQGRIIWCIGFSPDSTWVEAPVFNGRGHTGHQRGVTAQPGLYFFGLPWLYTWGRAFFRRGERSAIPGEPYQCFTRRTLDSDETGYRKIIVFVGHTVCHCTGFFKLFTISFKSDTRLHC